MARGYHDPQTSASAIGTRRRAALGKATRRYAHKIGARVEKIAWDRRLGPHGAYYTERNIRVFGCTTNVLDEDHVDPDRLARASRLLAHETWHGVTRDPQLHGGVEEGCVELLARHDWRWIIDESGLLDEQARRLVCPPRPGRRQSYQAEVDWIIALARVANMAPLELAERVLRDEWALGYVHALLASAVFDDMDLVDELYEAWYGAEGYVRWQHVFAAIWRVIGTEQVPAAATFRLTRMPVDMLIRRTKLQVHGCEAML